MLSVALATRATSIMPCHNTSTHGGGGQGHNDALGSHYSNHLHHVFTKSTEIIIISNSNRSNINISNTPCPLLREVSAYVTQLGVGLQSTLLCWGEPVLIDN